MSLTQSRQTQLSLKALSVSQLTLLGLVCGRTAQTGLQTQNADQPETVAIQHDSSPGS
jgi:hypothetical protein